MLRSRTFRGFNWCATGAAAPAEPGAAMPARHRSKFRLVVNNDGHGLQRGRFVYVLCPERTEGRFKLTGIQERCLLTSRRDGIRR